MARIEFPLTLINGAYDFFWGEKVCFLDNNAYLCGVKISREFFRDDEFVTQL